MFHHLSFLEILLGQHSGIKSCYAARCEAQLFDGVLDQDHARGSARQPRIGLDPATQLGLCVGARIFQNQALLLRIELRVGIARHTGRARRFIVHHEDRTGEALAQQKTARRAAYFAVVDADVELLSPPDRGPV